MAIAPHDSELSAHPLQSPISGNPLPQYGFGSEFSFDSLIQDNPFLFRVYTPKTQQLSDSAAEPYKFVGQKFNEHFTRAAEHLEDSSLAPDESVASICTYHDVAQHMDWTQRHMSPFISTTFSFVWAIWEATRRYRVGLKHDVEIAIIDARMLAGRAATALELLRKGNPRERHLDYWKWYRYALESQDVLVHGAIPGSAVLASVPLLSLIDKLPSYFLRQDRDPKSLPSSLDALSWDTMERKPSFRQFCQNMSDQFLRLSAEHRLRDATEGSVRLAMAFLRPWFYRVIAKDPTEATDKACTLSFMIAQWPAQWWSRDHLEMWADIRSLVQGVARGVQEKQKVVVDPDIRRSQSVVSDPDPSTDDEATVVSTTDRASDDDPKGDPVPLPTPPLSPPPSPPPSIVVCHYPVAPTVPDPGPAIQVVVPVAPPVQSPDNSHQTLILSPTIIIQEACNPPAEVHPSPPEHGSAKPRKDARSHSLVETASCVITGVVVGAIITLCIINLQRRTLIYVT